VNHLRYEPSPSFLEASVLVGMASMVMASNRKYSLFRVASIGMWIERSAHHRQIKIFYNMRGVPVGYLAWAYLSEDVIRRMVVEPDFLMHDSEWCEGDKFWILDICFRDGEFARTQSAVKDFIFRQAAEDSVVEVYWKRELRPIQSYCLASRKRRRVEVVL